MLIQQNKSLDLKIKVWHEKNDKKIVELRAGIKKNALFTEVLSFKLSEALRANRLARAERVRLEEILAARTNIKVKVQTKPEKKKTKKYHVTVTK